MEKVRDSIEIGKRLRELRNHFGLKQEELADQIKVHQSSIALFESGKRYLKDIYVKLICDEFGCDRNWLLYGDGAMITGKDYISIDEYARIYKLSPLERDIVSNFMELNKETKKASFESFVMRLLEYNQKAK